MRFVPPESNDLIIGMSLAELFLFIMLVTWWSTALPATAGGISPTIEIAQLNSRVHDLEGENVTLRTQLKDLQTHTEALRIALGVDPSTPLTGDKVRQIIQEARRG